MCTATKGYGDRPPSPVIFGFSSTTPAASNDPNRIVSVNNPNPDNMYTPGKFINKGATFTTAGGQTVDAATALDKQQTDAFGNVIASTRSAQLDKYVGLSLSPGATGQKAPVAQDDPSSPVQNASTSYSGSSGSQKEAAPQQASATSLSEQTSAYRKPSLTRDKLRQRFGLNSLVTAGASPVASTATKQLFGQ